MLEPKINPADEITRLQAALRAANKKNDQEAALVYGDGAKAMAATPEAKRQAQDNLTATREEINQIIERIGLLHDEAGHDYWPEGGLEDAEGRIFLERTEMVEGDEGAMAHSFYFANGAFDGQEFCLIRRWGRGKVFLLQPAPQFERVFTAEGGAEVSFPSLWRATQAVYYGFQDVQDMFADCF